MNCLILFITYIWLIMDVVKGSTIDYQSSLLSGTSLSENIYKLYITFAKDILFQKNEWRKSGTGIPRLFFCYLQVYPLSSNFSIRLSHRSKIHKIYLDMEVLYASWLVKSRIRTFIITKLIIPTIANISVISDALRLREMLVWLRSNSDNCMISGYLFINDVTM